MFTTTMAAVTMTGLLSTGAFLPGPTWVSDYGTALRQAADQSKPIAVFIANGSEGYTHVLKDGPMPSETAKLLKDKYVCLFVDTTTEAGKATAGAFELKEGLVISGRGGNKQALRHDGSVTSENLTKYLTQYAEPATVTTTVTNEAPVAAPLANPFYCPSCQMQQRR